MRRSLALLAALLAPCAAAIPAGGCNNQGAAADAGGDGTIVTAGGDSGNEDAEADGGGVLSSTMRLANMSPDLGPVDFCWRVAGSGSFTGPVIATPLDGGIGPGLQDASDAGDAAVEAESLDAGSPEAEEDAEDAPPDEAVEGESDASSDASVDGSVDAVAPSTDAGEATGDATAPVEAGVPVQVAFGAMTAYVELPAIGTIDIALVSPGQLSCSVPAFVGHVTLDPGKPATVAVMGLLGVDAGAASALVMRSFTDEPTSAQGIQVRFIHAALGWPGSDEPAPPLAVQAGSALLVPELDPTEVAAPSASPAIDSLGYATAPTFDAPAPIELSSLGDASPRTWTTPFFSLGLVPGTSHTAFVVSLGQGALGIAWCGGPQSVELPGSCIVQPAR
jgi:hypothetical protein